MTKSMPPLVVPTSLKFHTDLVPRLADTNPSLAQDVINALNVIDRSRNKLFRQVLGEAPKAVWSMI